MTHRRLRLVVGALAIVAIAAAGFAIGRTTGPGRGVAPRPSAVDVGFSQDMAVHHQQAILMATLAQTRAGPAVRAIAAGILNDQAQELGALRGWLRLWGAPSADPHPMAWMTDASMRGMDMSAMRMRSPSMPGMASAGQLTRLATLDGRRFDILFLQLMIRHHQGGILMADDARQHASLAPVAAGAAAMIAEQTEDLATMRGLLRADGGKQLPAPR